jgi:hypothetical protein
MVPHWGTLDEGAFPVTQHPQTARYSEGFLILVVVREHRIDSCHSHGAFGHILSRIPARSSASTQARGVTTLSITSVNRFLLGGEGGEVAK